MGDTKHFCYCQYASSHVSLKNLKHFKDTDETPNTVLFYGILLDNRCDIIILWLKVISVSYLSVKLYQINKMMLVFFPNILSSTSKTPNPVQDVKLKLTAWFYLQICYTKKCVLFYVGKNNGERKKYELSFDYLFLIKLSQYMSAIKVIIK